MSSRVMIIKNCEECPRSGLGFLKPRRVCLEMFRDDGSECECPEEGTPDWCPLPLLPEKRNTTNFIEMMREAEENHVASQHQAGFNRGWNACLKAITGGKEE